MNKEEFKELFKELCKSKEFDVSIVWLNDGHQYLRLKVDNEIMFEEQIEK